MLGDGIVSFGVAPSAASCEEREVLAEDRLRDAELAVDVQRGRRELDVAVGRCGSEPSGVPVSLRDAVELVDEVHVPRGAAELAVGDRLEPDLLLHATASRIASSSTARSAAASMRPAAKASRASSSRGGRSRLPTWSARNGGCIPAT